MKTFYLMFIIIISIMLGIGCQEDPSTKGMTNTMRFQEKDFGHTADGKKITSYTLTDGMGIKAELINYGAILVSLEVPDRNGKSEDITLGYDSLEGYIQDTPHLGATIGRYANRISKGMFTLDGETYTLATNNGENHLHGGNRGFNKVVWNAEKIETDDSVGVNFHYFSQDGEEGYPGNLDVNVSYVLNKRSELIVRYMAVTDKASPVNLTHHSYFNLTGNLKRDILGHQLMLNAHQYTPVDAGLIPTGEIVSVKGTNMDFTDSEAIGTRIRNVPGGYDHNYVLDKEKGQLVLAARVVEPTSGRTMEVYTTEPGIQFYSGNFLDGSVIGKMGKVYMKYAGLCLEPQHFPDSPNKAHFPSSILRQGEIYNQTMILKFLTN